MSFSVRSLVRRVKFCWISERVLNGGGYLRAADQVRLYHGGGGGSTAARDSGAWHTVDLRSDTVTEPGEAMRSAMAQARVGDDVLGEDPTVNELQKVAADMFGMESALFVPTGTMSNLIAVMVHCRERGDEMILGDLSHLHIYEQGGSAQSMCWTLMKGTCFDTFLQLAGVHSATLTTLADGTFDLGQLESKIRHDYPDAHYPRSRLVCVENTHNIMGGRVLPVSFLQQLRSIADKYGLAVHMDGARLMNAAVALGVHPSVMIKHCHSVSVCLSKGLGAPAGTILAGSKEFIQRAVRARKALGGGMRQAGILAAAGKIALLDMMARLEEDHRNARTFARALTECDPPLYHVDLASVETNIVRFSMRVPGLSPTRFCQLMEEVTKEEVDALNQGVRVLMFPHAGGTVRAVWHLGISKEDTHLAIKKAQFVAQQFGLKAKRNR